MTSHPKGARDSRASDVCIRAVRAGRRIRQPRHQPHGALPQPGHPRARRLLPADVPSVVGHHDDSGEYFQSVHGAGFSDPRSLCARARCTNQYDVVGISSIIVNVGKVREMCRMVRELSPESTIVIGGHVTAIPGVEKLLDADHIVKGEGIRLDARIPGRESGPRDPASGNRFRPRNPDPGRTPSRSQRRRPRPRSFRRSAVPWAATSAPRRRSSAARASS